MNIGSIGWREYVLMLTDDYTRYVNLMNLDIKCKSEVLSKFVKYVSMLENETGLWVWEW